MQTPVETRRLIIEEPQGPIYKLQSSQDMTPAEREIRWLPPFPRLEDPVITRPVTPEPYNPAPVAGSPYLEAIWSRLMMPFGWNDRPLVTNISQPEAMNIEPSWMLRLPDGWQRAIPRMAAQALAFVPYREPRGLRGWDPITPWVEIDEVVKPGTRAANVLHPSVRVEKRVPFAAAPGESMRYEILITNTSNVPLADVNVIESIDVSRVTATQPPALVEPTGLMWRLGGLAVGESRQLGVEYWTSGQEELRPVTEIEVGNSIAAATLVEGNQEVPFFQPDPVPEFEPVLPEIRREPELPTIPLPLELPPFPTTVIPTGIEMQPVRDDPIEAVDMTPRLGAKIRVTVLPAKESVVGEDAVTTYEVENIGDLIAEDVILTLSLPSGLEHHDGSREVEHHIRQLLPGTMRRAQLVTRAQLPGRFPLNGLMICGRQMETTYGELFVRQPVVLPSPQPQTQPQIQTQPQTQPLPQFPPSSIPQPTIAPPPVDSRPAREVRLAPPTRRIQQCCFTPIDRSVVLD
ncbi:MAG: hypothetical protein R3B90_06780 [Planctomycetaceae bacterium]